VEDRVRRHRQPLITNANHEDTLTNVRSTRPAIMDGLHMVDVREYKPRTLPGSEGSSTRTTPTPTL